MKLMKFSYIRVNNTRVQRCGKRRCVKFLPPPGVESIPAQGWAQRMRSLTDGTGGIIGPNTGRKSGK